MIFKNDWASLLQDELAKDYYRNLRKFLFDEYKTKMIYPHMDDIFNALHATSYADTKAVIIGQDPYHGPGQAHGMSFSVQSGVKPPPSLQNIFKELHQDLGVPIPTSGYLGKWAEQGVLLLNAVLTVRQGSPNSHQDKGWEIFTDRVISLLSQREEPVVYILWGKNAQAKRSLIDTKRHFIIASPHPSPFSAHRGFFGSKPFSRVNDILQELGKKEIEWKL
ncbi:uracil-DNA glycosylase [Desulfitispora alkaliphila]|uniref:uracil-DNA glycosylase n=1 Tax=Desulfitispora alkaliphila TaxID=622674 RepID=UPI003D19C20E